MVVVVGRNFSGLESYTVSVNVRRAVQLWEGKGIATGTCETQWHRLPGPDEYVSPSPLI